MATTYQDQVDVALQLTETIPVPALSDAVIELRQLFERTETPDPMEIKKYLSQNPFLSGEVVALANLYAINSNYGVQIKDLNTAIIRLGSQAIKNFALAVEIKKLLDKNRIASLSAHSQRIAEIIHAIAKYTGGVSPDEAYLVGLLHDIGAFVIAEVDHDYGKVFINRLNDHYQLEKREVEQYGTTHAAMSYVLARSWKIPKYIAQALLLHHSKNLHDIENGKLRSMVAMVEFAHTLEIKLFDSKHEKPINQEVFEYCKEVLGLSDEDVRQIQLQLKSE